MLRTGKSSKRRAIWLATAVAALGIGGLAPPARAQIMFDPDGSGGAFAPKTVTAFNNKPGNVLAVGAATGIIDAQDSANITGMTTSTDPFLVLYQAAVNTVSNANTTVFSPDLQGFELTFVLRFMEIATVNPNPDPDGGGPLLPSPIPLSTALTTVAGTNSVELYASPFQDAVDLSGNGFRDGTLILTGTVDVGGPGSFGANPPSIGPLDPTSPAAQNAGIRTINGGGGTFLNVTVTGVVGSYFPGVAPGSISLFFDTSNNTPFPVIDPALAFYSLAAPVALGGTSVLLTPNLVRNITGNPLGVADGINTSPFPNAQGLDVNGVEGPDFQFQATANVTILPVVATVPEPATVSMALTGAGLLSLSALRRRRRARAGTLAA